MTTRRAFLTSTALALPATMHAAANDTLNVACLGTGGRCMHLMRVLAKLKNVRLAAVCDVWDKHLADARKIADPKAIATKDYKSLLERDDIDAVLIGSPDHWHVPMTIDAVKAGKHAYVEKPLTHELAEGKAVLDAVKKSGKIVQVGTQQRSMPHIARAKELVDKGRLGTPVKVRMSWNRNADRMRRNKLGVDPKSVDWKAFVGAAPKQDFDEYRFRNWRWFWDFGGGLFTDLMVHWVDVAHWLLKLDHPRTAVALGEHVAAKGVWQTPDTVQCVLSYPGPIQVHFEGTFSNRRAGAMIEVMGTNATLYIDRGRFELVPEKDSVKAEELILGTGPRGKDFYDKPDGELLHLQNWVDCVRANKQPSAPVEAGVSAAAAAHLANTALREGGAASYKPDA